MSESKEEFRERWRAIQARPINKLFRALEEVADESEGLMEMAERACLDGAGPLGIVENNFDGLHKMVEDAREAYHVWRDR